MTQAGAATKTVRFLLDTNFLLLPGQFKVDIFDELRRFGKDHLYTLDLVVRELQQLSHGASKHSSSARLALHLVRDKGISIIHTEDDADLDGTDAAIRKAAKKRHFMVCTQDRELIGLLKEDGVPVISMRQGRYLERV
jgi:rRNA-processing protein FCF1